MPPAQDVDVFERWTHSRKVKSLGTNSGSDTLAFQGWHKFKEAFAPELILRAVQQSPRPVTSCLDPFGGSGTTSLAAQLLGIASTTVEVNPFLADVIRAKLAHIDADRLSRSLGAVCDMAARSGRARTPWHSADMPNTFIEPGVGGRWLFNREVAQRLGGYLCAIGRLTNETERRFFKVALGGILVEVSNVTVNGKGRRYRRHWKRRTIGVDRVDHLFVRRCQLAIADIHHFVDRPQPQARVLYADARRFRSTQRYDVAIFSPPYPNSFDYTDVYNIELWMLGYLTTGGQFAVEAVNDVIPCPDWSPIPKTAA